MALFKKRYPQQETAGEVAEAQGAAQSVVEQPVDAIITDDTEAVPGEILVGAMISANTDQSAQGSSGMEQNVGGGIGSTAAAVTQEYDQPTKVIRRKRTIQGPTVHVQESSAPAPDAITDAPAVTEAVPSNTYKAPVRQ